MKTFVLFLFSTLYIIGYTQNKEKIDTSLINLIIDYGKTYEGTPYKYGSCSSQNNGFDCSGFMYYIFKMAGIKIDRSSYEISLKGKRINYKKLKVGDFVFFDTFNQAKVSHVGIISHIEKDNILMLHVSTSKGVQEINFKKSSYWNSNFLFGKRYFF